MQRRGFLASLMVAITSSRIKLEDVPKQEFVKPPEPLFTSVYMGGLRGVHSQHYVQYEAGQKIMQGDLVAINANGKAVRSHLGDPHVIGVACTHSHMGNVIVILNGYGDY